LFIKKTGRLFDGVVTINRQPNGRFAEDAVPKTVWDIVEPVKNFGYSPQPAGPIGHILIAARQPTRLSASKKT
jgi:hypothetical protein